MDDQLRVFLSTIYGEAALSSLHAWRAIASVILNRVGHREWHKLTSPFAVITAGGFDAYTQQNPPYRGAWRALGRQEVLNPNSPILRLKAAVQPLYEPRENPTTQAVLYYSPKAQARLHADRPEIYRGAVPHWNFALLDEVTIPGTEGDDFRWFKYKEAVA
jgi:hypothetical protein